MSVRLIPKVRVKGRNEPAATFFVRVAKFVDRHEGRVLTDITYYDLIPSYPEEEYLKKLRKNLERLRDAYYLLTTEDACHNCVVYRYMVVYTQNCINRMNHSCRDWVDEGFEDLEIEYRWEDHDMEE